MGADAPKSQTGGTGSAINVRQLDVGLCLTLHLIPIHQPEVERGEVAGDVEPAAVLQSGHTCGRRLERPDQQLALCRHLKRTALWGPKGREKKERNNERKPGPRLKEEEGDHGL